MWFSTSISLKLFLTTINHKMVIDKDVTKILKFCILQVTFFSLKFIRTVFVSFIISSDVINELSMIIAKHFQFLQLRVAGFQIQSFSHI